MFEKLKKILKRNCKNRGKNITTCTVVAFLLSCNLVMAGNGFGYDFNFDGTDIKITEHHVDGSSSPWTFDKDDTTQFDGKFAEDEWDNTNNIFTQNGTINLTLEAKNSTVEKSTGISIQTKPTIAFDEEVYGLKLTTSGTPFNFIQNGTIAISYTETEIKHAGDSDKDITRKDKGNGLVIADDGITVDVNGNIKGEIELYGAENVGQGSNVKYATANADATASANGIYITNSTSTIGNITGSINGSAILTGGNNTTANHSDGNGNASSSNADATAKPTATASATANGIYMESSQNTTIDDITGSINGFAVLTGGNTVSATTTAIANGVPGNWGAAKSIATAKSTATANTTANGIYMKSSQNTTIGDITGSINGFAILTGGNGVTANATAAGNDSNATANADSSASTITSANGIYMESSQNTTIGDITGSINGFVILAGGNGVTANANVAGGTNTPAANTDSSADATDSANGIYMKSSQNTTIGDITGSINGFAILQKGSVSSGTPNISITANTSANGIYFSNSKDINNSGKIQGYVQAFENDGTTTAGIDTLSFSGNGIAIGTDYSNKLDNIGVIAGSGSAVALTSLSGAINNYGIMAGKNILSKGDGTSFTDGTAVNDYGLTLILSSTDDDDDNKKHLLEVSKISGDYKGGLKENIEINGEKYNIWNADKNSDTETKSIVLKDKVEYDKYIFNGKNNTVSIASGVESNIKDSVINAFETAVNMEGGELSITDTVINGGADIKYTYSPDAYDPNDKATSPEDIIQMEASSPALKFSVGGNKFHALGKSVINGDIKVESVDNEITLGLYSQLNGDIIGNGTKDNTLLCLGAGKKASNSDTLNIQNNITNINHIDIDNNVTFYENISVTGEKITIAQDGVLNLRLAKGEGTKEIDGSKDVQVAEHALDEFNGKLIGYGNGITSTNVGTLKLITQGIGKAIFVPFGEQSYSANENIENIKIKASTILDTAKTVDNGIYIKAGSTLNNIVINGDNILDPNPRVINRYEQLNKIYKSIYSSGGGNLDALRNILSLGLDYNFDDKNNYDDNDSEQLKTLLYYLNGVYSHSPYAFSSELSRKSVGMFRDIVTDNSFIPNYKKWLVMGGLTHQDAGTTDTYYGKNYHGFDTGTADVDADSKLTGAYVLAKYGYSDKVTLGITAGGNKGDSELSTDSKVKDNAGYIGGFIENYRGNLTLKAGAGVQYSEFDADRKTVNDSYSDKYSDMTYDIYGSLRYSLPLDNNFFLEPYGVLAYTHVDQEGADEGNKALAIETDDKEFNYTTVKAGVDLKKVIPTEKAKHTLTAGVSYERFLDGDDEEYITGRMKGGTDFDILVAHKNKHQISLNAKYEVEREDGILFNLKGEYSFERDEHNNGAKNKTAGEWTVGASIGYKL